jgi:hypothetical protein
MHYRQNSYASRTRTFRSFVRRNPDEQNYSSAEQNYSSAEDYLSSEQNFTAAPAVSVPRGWRADYMPITVTAWMTRAAANNKRFAAQYGWGLNSGSRFSGVDDPQLPRVVSDFQYKVLRFPISASDGQIGPKTLQAIIDWKARTSFSSERGTVQYLANELSLPRSAGGGSTGGGTTSGGGSRGGGTTPGGGTPPGGTTPGGTTPGGGSRPPGGAASSGSNTTLIAGLLAAAAGAVYFLG